MQTESEALSTSMLNLGLEILRKSSPQENLVISPTSILVAMAMLHEGATGATRDEIASLFGRASESSFARQLGELLTKLTQQRIIDEGLPDPQTSGKWWGHFWPIYRSATPLLIVK